MPDPGRPLDPLSRLATHPAAFLAFTAGLVLYAALGVRELAIWGRSDFWEHLASIAAIARNPMHPGDPYLPVEIGSHLLTPFHLAWGLVSRVTRIPAYELSPAIAAGNMLLFAFAVRRLAARLCGDARWALPLGLAMLFLWNAPYVWSGFHNFGVLPVTAVYPFWCALSLSMLCIAATDPSRPATVREHAGRIAAAAIVFVIHPLTGGFLVLALATIGAWLPGVPGKRRAFEAMTPLLGVVLALAWPMFNVAAALLAAPEFTGRGFAGEWSQFYDAFPLKLLPAAIGLLHVAGWLVRRRRADAFDLLLLACAALYVLNPFTLRSSLLARFVIYVALTLQWSAVRWLATDAGLMRRPARMVLFILVIFVAAIGEVRASRAWLVAPAGTAAAAPLPDRDRAARFRTYSRHLGPGEVTLARLDESWVLPALTGSRVVAVKHSSPFMTDFSERRDAVRRFFGADCATECRQETLQRYGVTRILLHRTDAPRFADLATYPVLFADDTYEIRGIPARR